MLTDDATQGFSIKVLPPDEYREQREMRWSERVWKSRWDHWLEMGKNGEQDIQGIPIPWWQRRKTRTS